MKELKINPELRDFLPPLPLKDFEKLEKKIISEGYKGLPIYTWNGYIVDGHHRYEICKKHNIEFQSEELLLCDNATIVDYMEWMLNNQEGRRNLTAVDRLLAAEKLRDKIAEEAKEKYEKTVGRPSKENRSPNGEQLNSTEPKIHTDKELAKIAGVGTGTVARFNQVMKSGDDDLIQKVKNGEVSINAGYKAVKEKEKNEMPLSNEAFEETTEIFIEEDIIPESVVEICKDLKTEKSKEYLESLWDLHDNVLDCIESMFDDFYEPVVSSVEEIEGRVDENGRKECVICLKNMSNKLLELSNRVKGMELKNAN